MNKRLALITGLGVGAGVMFLLDPDRGKRRRALARDKAIRLTRVTGCTIGKLSRDLQNRAIGLVSKLRSTISDGGIPDSILVRRVKGGASQVSNSRPIHFH